MGTELTPVQQICQSIEGMRDKFVAALPPHVTVEKFVRIGLTAVQGTPALVQCDRASVYNELLKCAQDGLLPDGREAALVPFKGKAKYMPMIGGILKKVRNSGELASITSQVVFQNDKFKYWVDDEGEHLEHEPLVFGERGKALGVYALAKLKDGSVMMEFMTADQVEAVRQISRAQDGPWSGPFAHEMWRKTVVRRLSKRLPMSTDLEEFIHRDDDLYDLDGKENKEPAKPANTRPKRLNNIVGGQAGKQPEKAAEPAQDAEYETVEDAPAPAAKAPEKPHEPAKKDEIVAMLPDDMLPAGYKTVEGKIDDLKVKSGTNKNGAWKRFSCRVNGEYYGTFSDELGKTMTESCDAQIAVRIYYTTRKDGDKVFRDIAAIQQLQAVAAPAEGGEDVPI